MKKPLLSLLFILLGVIGHIAAQPANDHWAAAAEIGVVPARLYGSATGATLEAGEPIPVGSHPEGTLWWRWTPGTTNTVAVFALRDTAAGRQSVGRVDVYRGSTLVGLFPLWRQLNDDTPLLFTGFPGEAYYFQLRVNPGVSGKFWLQVEDRPTNDSFAQRRLLVGTHPTDEVVNSLATFEPGEKLADPTGLRRTVWYRWKAPGTGQLLVVGRAINWAPVLGVGPGNAVGSVTWLVPSEADVLGSNLMARRYPVTAGTDYNLVLDGSRYASEPSLPATDHHGLATLDLHFSSLRLANLTNEARLRHGDPFTVQLQSRHPDLDGVPAELTLGVTSELGETKVSVRVPVKSMAVPLPEMAPGSYFLFAEGRNQAGEYLETPAVKIRVFPANDRFADRTVISPDGGLVETSLINSSRETGEPANGSGQTVGSVWWTFVAPTSGNYLLNVQGAPMGVYAGSTPGPMMTVLSPVTSAAFFPVQAGKTYHLAAFAVERAAGEGLPARFQLFAPGDNDGRGNRPPVELPPGESSFKSHDYASSFAPDEPEPVRIRGAGSVWWDFTVPRDGRVMLRAFRQPNWPLGLVLYAKTTNSTFGEPLATGVGFSGTLDAWLRSGVTYSLAIVRSEQDVGGPFTLSAEFTPFPDNDQFDRRIRLQGPALDVSGTVFGATVEAGEVPWGWGSVWWEWSAPETGLLRLTSTANAYLSAYAVGESVASLSELPSVAGGAQGLGLREVLVTQGQAVAIRLGCAPDAPGEIPFRLTFQPTPEAANDQFADRTRLGEPGGNVDLPANVSTAEPGEPIFWGAVEGVAPGSVWFEWTAPHSARIRLKVAPPAMMRIFRNEPAGASPSGLVALSDFRTAVFGDVKAGETICVAVYRPYPLATRLLLDWALGPTNRVTEIPGNRFSAEAIRLDNSGSARVGIGGAQPFWNDTETIHHWVSDAYGDVTVRPVRAGSTSRASVYQESMARAPVAEGEQFRFAVSPGQKTWFRMVGNAAAEPETFELVFTLVKVQTGYEASTNGWGTVWARGPAGRGVAVESSTGLFFWVPAGSLTLAEAVPVGLNLRMDTNEKFYRFRLKP